MRREFTLSLNTHLPPSGLALTGIASTIKRCVLEFATAINTFTKPLSV